MLGPLAPRGSGGGAYLALDDSGATPRLYVGGLSWRNSSVNRLTDADGKLAMAGYITGFDVWARKPEGDVGFTGDLACVDGTLLSSGQSSWGFRGAKWTSYDARTGAFKGLVEMRDPKGKSFKASGHGELVSGKDGNLYSQVSSGTVFRFHGNGKAFPFPARSGFALGGLYQLHSRQTGVFASRDGRIYVPTGYQKSRGEGRKPLNVIDRTRVVVFDADGNEISPAAVKVEQTRVAGLAADRQGNIYLGARTAPKDQQLPAWIDGRLPADATSQTRTTYQQVATIFKFSPSGGEIRAEEDGKWITALNRGPTPADVQNALWSVRGGLVPRKWGCYCETTRLDIDGYGRLFIPDTLRFSVLVVDAAGNQVSRIGGYGNMDNRGPDSAHPRPAIAFAWPLSARVHDGMLVVADQLNCRLLSAALMYEATATCEVRK